MKVQRMDEIRKEPHVSRLFTGTDVTRQALLTDSKDFRIGIVNFGKGVKNKLHTHDGEQLLIITAGKGYVATEQEKKTVTVGDIVVFSAGEKHWHGATEDSAFSHLVITKTGVKMTQLED